MKNRPNNLILDDDRTFEQVVWIHRTNGYDVLFTIHEEWDRVHDYKEFCDYIDKCGTNLPPIITFDYRIEGWQPEAKTGLDCAKYLGEHIMDNFYQFPKDVILPLILTHSSDITGRQEIFAHLQNVYAHFQRELTAS